MATVPIIETERLILRDHRLSDFDDYAAMWRDPVVTRFIGGRAREREEVWIRLLRYAGMWQLLGFGLWAIEEKSSGRLVGEAGFHELMRAIEPSLEGTLEAGWTLLPDTHGKGYAGEAVAAMLDWAAATQPGKPITCFIEPGNAASIRLATRNGFVERLRTTYGDTPVIIFDLAR